jgi:hypothetical protein
MGVLYGLDPANMQCNHRTWTCTRLPQDKGHHPSIQGWGQRPTRLHQLPRDYTYINTYQNVRITPTCMPSRSPYRKRHTGYLISIRQPTVKASPVQRLSFPL